MTNYPQGGRREVLARIGGPSKTKTDMQKSCDVNNIMRKYERTGLVNHVARHQGQYGEFAEIDFHEAANAVLAAEQMFMELPAKVRAEFSNNPGEFLRFVENPENGEKMRELGLLPAKAPDESPAPRGGETPPEPPGAD